MSKKKEYIELFIGADTYDLQLTHLDEFREKFGISVNGVDEDEFVLWARDNHIKFHKKICVDVVVGIDEYLKGLHDE